MPRNRTFRWPTVGALALGGLLLTLGTVPAAGATPSTTGASPAGVSSARAGAASSPHGTVGIVPRHRGKVSAVIPGAMTNHGGPVQGIPKVYVVYWGWTTDPKGVRPYLNSFLQGLGGNDYLSSVTQYGGGNPVSMLGGTWSDTSVPPASPTDAQVQAKASAAAAHFGLASSVNTQIVVATPTGHSTAGFGSTFCAYHGRIAGSNTTYTNLPYMPDQGATCGQGSVNGAAGTLDGVSIVEGHELAEAITDPWLNAWYDAGGAEIGDKCAWTGLANIRTPQGTFAVQPEWRNASNGCVLTAAGATTVAGVADYDRDGKADIVVRDNASGLLWLYPGPGARGYSPFARVQIGNGWNGMTFAGVADYDRDGKADIIARDPAGLLWLYPGGGTRGYSPFARVQIGNGWNGLTFAGLADYDNDGKVDIVVRDNSTAKLWLYPGPGARGYSPFARVEIGNGWSAMTFAGVADYDKDGKADIVARDSTTGLLWLYPGPGARGYSPFARVQIGNGWNSITFAGLADYDNDTKVDIIGRDDASRLLWLYPGPGARGYSPFARVQIGNGW